MASQTQNLETFWSVEVVNLTQKHFIAKGSERECYTHPKYHDKVIKIQISNTTNRNQNNLDEFYYDYLSSKNVSYKHIARYYGKIGRAHV